MASSLSGGRGGDKARRWTQSQLYTKRHDAERKERISLEREIDMPAKDVAGRLGVPAGGVWEAAELRVGGGGCGLGRSPSIGSTLSPIPRAWRYGASHRVLESTQRLNRA